MSSVPSVRQMSHPTLKQYIVVAAFLAIITAIEVVVIYIDALDPGIAPLLIALSGVKFATVVMFYMHLKFDSRLFTWVFVAGLALAFGRCPGYAGTFWRAARRPRTQGVRRRTGRALCRIGGGW